MRILLIESFDVGDFVPYVPINAATIVPTVMHDIWWLTLVLLNP